MKLPASYLLIVTTLLSVVVVPSCITIDTPGKETYYVTEFVTENRSEPFSETVPVTTFISGEDVLAPDIAWSGEAFVFKGIKHVWYHGYDISGLKAHENEKIKVIFSKQQFFEYASIFIFDMSPRGQILSPPRISAADKAAPPDIMRDFLIMQGNSSTFDKWLNLANFKLNHALLLGSKSDLWLNYQGPYAMELDTKGATSIAIIVGGPSVPQNVRFNAMRTWSDSTVKYVTRSGERSVTYQIEKKVAMQREVTTSRQAPFWEPYLPK
jgi:hypothetical protein